MAPELSAAGSEKYRSYCRKQKSLGLLCTNFLNLYDQDGVDVIGLDDAATKLGVERRRIYDIVNVLESVGLLTKKAKNQYSWRGFEALPKAFEELKVEGLKENLNSVDGKDKDCVKVSDDDDDEDDENGDSDSNPNTGRQNGNLVPGVKSTVASRFDNRKEKSLGLLTQHFIKLFLCSDVILISLEEAAKLLLGDGHNLSMMRTKVRRLYDIVNVLASMRLIEKTRTAETRKPAFRWLGFRGKPQVGVCDASTLSGPRKRTFGADISNICFTRDQIDSSVVGGENVNPKLQKQLKVEDSHDQGSRSYQFGPFTPASMLKVSDSGKKVTHMHDWESLSSIYHPKYHNEAMRDLFGHYSEALKSWHTEVGGKKHIHQIS